MHSFAEINPPMFFQGCKSTVEGNESEIITEARRSFIYFPDLMVDLGV